MSVDSLPDSAVVEVEGSLLPKSSYSESHRKSYLKRRDSEIERMKTYYHANKERINTARKEKYKQKKLTAISL